MINIKSLPENRSEPDSVLAVNEPKNVETVRDQPD